MTMPTKQNPIPKAIALILVSICGALLLKGFDASALAKLDSMSASKAVQYQREIHQHAFVYHFIWILILGGFFLGIVEFITCVIGLLFHKKPDVSHEDSSLGTG
ncbi:MAG: hypothetical protein ABSC18_13920 [Verrucomicrobiota bacterium]